MSWMSKDLFEKWLCELDRKFHDEERRVVMIIENCPAHRHIENLKAITLDFLPKNTTSIKQPTDQVKLYYTAPLLFVAHDNIGQQIHAY